MTDVQPYVKSAYWVGGILILLAFFGFVPSWVGVVIVISAFVLNWQLKAHKKAEVEAGAQDALALLYKRYAPVLTGDNAIDQKYLEEKITALHEAEGPDLAVGFADIFDGYIAKWDKDYGQPLPHYITYAIVRDFEYIKKFMGSEDQRAVATSRALIDRFEDFDHWLQVTGTPITAEEVDVAEEILRANQKAKEQLGSD
ncbi:hypothetical protein [Polynucleobacter sp. UB-Raua-W9]|uniref:hypothetical protein n=1 Tax=Polynucleobacter sp. UB-Raua-W9 TaxID=1819736 RepID=UPI001BFDAFF6|nr:hypothetical protein [Polynucleobacter sp. UB-Raua-W9]QWD71583.1 hypothetical protein AOC07_04780 [Polynucleobacter sp. UB-Raua-W9]